MFKRDPTIGKKCLKEGDLARYKEYLRGCWFLREPKTDSYPATHSYWAKFGIYLDEHSRREKAHPILTAIKIRGLLLLDGLAVGLATSAVVAWWVAFHLAPRVAVLVIAALMVWHFLQP